MKRNNSVASVQPSTLALDRLAAIEPWAAEVVKLRYFAGLTVAEAAAVLGISPRTADNDWTYARAWLFTALRDDS